MFTRPVDKVPHNQQVASDVHVADTVEFLVHALAHVCFVSRELEILIGESPFEALIAKMRDVNIGIAARLAPAMNIFLQSLLVVVIKKFRLRETVDFRIVRISQSLFGKALFGTVSGLDLLFAVLDNTLELTFANDRIFRIVFRLHDRLDALVFLRSEKLVRNLEPGPELVTDTRFHGKVTAFSNLDRIFDGARDMSEQFHHFFFRAEVEFFRRETLVVKTALRYL